jgi:hypothetical protein
MNDVLCIIPYYDFYGKNEYILRNHKQAVAALQAQGVTVLTMEAAYRGNRRIKDTHDTIHVNVNDILWYKESLINYAIKICRQHHKYLVWMDSGFLLSDGWVEAATKKLSKGECGLVQCFDHGVWTNPGGGLDKKNWGYVCAHHTGIASKCKVYPSPGGAWMVRASDCDDKPFLHEVNIVGGGDTIFTNASMHQGQIYHPLTPPHLAHYKEWYEEFKERDLSVSYIEGQFTHLWHTTHKQRRLVDRHHLLTQAQYNPYIDLKHANGVLAYTDAASGELRTAVANHILNRMIVAKYTPPVPSWVARQQGVRHDLP